MGYKERQPVNRKVIKHGKDKGIIDMSFSPSEAKIPEGGVNVGELLREVRQEPLPKRIKRLKGS